MDREKIRRFAIENIPGAEGVRMVGRWTGHEVWAGVFSEPVYLGLPVFILVRGESIRLAMGEEGDTILDSLLDDRRHT
jgi:hypothetical protein